MLCQPLLPDLTTERGVVEDLMQWEQVFGDGFKAIFTFIYRIESGFAAGRGNV